MYRWTLQIIGLLLAALLPTHGAAEGTPYAIAHNYTVEDYKASCQNWDIAISYRGMIYVANNSGLLTFDGNTWQLYPLPDKQPLFQVTFRQDTVYSRSQSGYGYWTHNTLGTMEYHPIDRLPPDVRFDTAGKQTYPLPAGIESHQPTAFAIAGNYRLTGTLTNGLYITNEKNQLVRHLSTDNQLQDNIVRSICVQDTALFWLALDNGIARVVINPPAELLGKRSQIGKPEAAVKRGETLYLRTNAGYFRLNLGLGSETLTPIPKEKGSRIIPPAPLVSSPLTIEQIFPGGREALGAFAEADKVYPAANDHFWLTLHNEAGLFQLDKQGASLKCRLLLDNHNLNLVTSDPRIISLDDSLHLISTMQGTYLVNTRQLIEEGLGKLNMPSFTRIAYEDKAGNRLLPADRTEVRLPANFLKIDCYVGTTVFTPNHLISYRLDGVSSEWSPWQDEGKISFMQLPEGNYTLRVRKYVVQGPFPEINLRIEVAPAWYKTTWAYLGYLLLLLLAIGTGSRVYIRIQYRKEQARMENKRLEEERRMQQLKSEMLEAELQNKNNELTLQTSALVKRNEAIQTLLEELDNQKRELGDRYPNKLYNRLRSLMESSLNNQADWVQFESYFNSAHRHFMDRLRQQYTDITSGDLRICCLLRMNLSTKEIASLMNVSLRAIELRRYRLRKRLGLDAETNLVDFLMNF